MKQTERNLPLSMVALIFGALSIPLAFARHLVSLAVVLGVLAILFSTWGERMNTRHILRYTAVSAKRTNWGFRLGVVGTLCALVMWALWTTNKLF